MSFATERNLNHVLTHIRATAPVNVQSVANWMLEQIPGVGVMEMDMAARECLVALRNRGLVELDEEKCIWPTRAS
jgi:hypothetical protein